MSKKNSQAQVTNEGLGPLIERLGPLNNQWRSGTPADKVQTLWAIGDALLDFAQSPSDSLLWEVQERSYMTRNMLRYAVIVRRSWENPEDLKGLVRGLHNYTVFREALPFLKGNREGINEETYQKVVAQLTDKDIRGAISYLKDLKGKAIGRKHKKGGSKTAVRDEAVSFVNALSQLESEVIDKVNIEGSSDALVTLSRMAMAMATADAVDKLLPSVTSIEGRLSGLAKPLAAAAKGDRASISAFRTIVGAERLMQAADLFNSMRTNSSLEEWRRRRGATISSTGSKSQTGGKV